LGRQCALEYGLRHGREFTEAIKLAAVLGEPDGGRDGLENRRLAAAVVAREQRDGLGEAQPFDRLHRREIEPKALTALLADEPEDVWARAEPALSSLPHRAIP
jgi:hypothetical protein